MARCHLEVDICVFSMYIALRRYADATYRLALGIAAVSVRVNAEAFHRLLWERCMTGEELRRELKLSPATLAKFHSGGRVRDDIFKAVVDLLGRREVSRIAQELTGAALERSDEAAAG